MLRALLKSLTVLIILVFIALIVTYVRAPVFGRAHAYVGELRAWVIQTQSKIEARVDELLVKEKNFEITAESERIEIAAGGDVVRTARTESGLGETAYRLGLQIVSRILALFIFILGHLFLAYLTIAILVYWVVMEVRQLVLRRLVSQQ